MKIMKSPEDLDPFEDDQVELTRAIEVEGPAAIENLVRNAMVHTTVLALRIGSTMPMFMWRRAAHEAAAMAKSNPHRPELDGIAKALWLVVLFIQGNIALSQEKLSDPAVRERMRNNGFSVTEKPEEE